MIVEFFVESITKYLDETPNRLNFPKREKIESS